MHLRRVVLAGCLAGGLVVPAALAGEGSDVRGTSFDVAASAGPASIRGKGTVDVDAPLGGSGSLVQTRVSGARKVALTLQLTTWRVSVSGSVTTLVLNVRVGASAVRSGCPVGSRGTVRLVDAVDGGDAVQTAFRRASCRSFARVWSSGAGDVAQVGITVIRQ